MPIQAGAPSESANANGSCRTVLVTLFNSANTSFAKHNLPVRPAFCGYSSHDVLRPVERAHSRNPRRGDSALPTRKAEALPEKCRKEAKSRIRTCELRRWT